MIGTRRSQYEVLDELGRGAMGVVYKARDTRLNRTVALKVLPVLKTHDPHARERFEQEARAASALDHPNICTIYEIGDFEDGQLFIAMAHYEGRTLDRVLDEDPFDMGRCLDWSLQIAEGLAAAHSGGIIHRDVKPENIILTDDGRIKLLDFGLAKIDDIQITRDGLTLGTVAYMSPEQAQGGIVDAGTDQWSFGVVVFRLLAHQLPFQREYAQATLYSIINEDPVPIESLEPDVPPEVSEIVTRCLTKEPSSRFASMDEVVVALRSLINAGDGQPTLRTSRRRVTAVAMASVVATLLILFAIAPLRDATLNMVGFERLPGEKHLAVLPTPNTSGDTELEAFTNGLVETVISSLSRFESTEGNLWVVPTHRVRAFHVENASQAYRSLGVNLVVSIAVERDAAGTRVALDLQDAARSQSLRSSVVNQAANDHSNPAGDIILAVAELLNIDLTAQAHRSLTIGQTSAPGAYDFYTQGLGYLQKYREGKNLDASVILFKRAILRDSVYALAYAGLCEAYWRRFEETEDSDWADEASTNCETAIELDAEPVPVYVTMGRLHTGTGRYGTAIAEFNLALARDSLNVSALNGLALAYEALGRVDDAEEAFLRAIALKPDYWGGYNDLGVFYFNLSRYEEAIIQFLHVADLNPFNARAYSNLGAIYFYLERRPEAIEMFNLALEIEEDHQIYSNLATLLYYEGRYDEAAASFEAAIRLGEAAYDTWGYLSSAYRWSGQEAKFQQALRQAVVLAGERLEVNPRDQEVLAHLAAYNAQLGNRDESLALLDKVIASSPTDPQDLSRIGEAFEVLGERVQAMVWLEKALKNGYAVTEIRDYPGFEDLRSDPRFQAILTKYETSDEP